MALGIAQADDFPLTIVPAGKHLSRERYPRLDELKLLSC
jgi:hypothetical protein